MAQVVIGYLFSFLKSFVTKKVIEELAVLAIKEISQYTENTIDDKIVELVEKNRSKI